MHTRLNYKLKIKLNLNVMYAQSNNNSQTTHLTIIDLIMQCNTCNMQQIKEEDDIPFLKKMEINWRKWRQVKLFIHPCSTFNIMYIHFYDVATRDWQLKSLTLITLFFAFAIPSNCACMHHVSESSSRVECPCPFIIISK